MYRVGIQIRDNQGPELQDAAILHTHYIILLDGFTLTLNYSNSNIMMMFAPIESRSRENL